MFGMGKRENLLRCHIGHRHPLLGPVAVGRHFFIAVLKFLYGGAGGFTGIFSVEHAGAIAQWDGIVGNFLFFKIFGGRQEEVIKTKAGVGAAHRLDVWQAFQGSGVGEGRFFFRF